MKSFTLLSLASLRLVAVARAKDSTPTATVDSGMVIGISTELPEAKHAVNKFLGIPYAAPIERFERAKAPIPWSDPVTTDDFGPSCIQYFIDNDIALDPQISRLLTGAISTTESENCLFLNVFAPADRDPKDAYPVVVFIHGGGWQLGHGGVDMSSFAAYEDIVGVSFNYRTNFFGFPNIPQIPVESRNLGLHDQRLAIEWVQNNIAAFGGDPAKVTLWGASAGAMSTDLHLHTYADDEHLPFRGAILASGQMSWGLLGQSANPDDTDLWESIATDLGCHEESFRLDCVKLATVQDIINAITSQEAIFVPVQDNKTVPEGRPQSWEHGHIVRVSMLTSTVLEEGRSLLSHDIGLEDFVSVYLPESQVPKDTGNRILNHYQGLPQMQTDFDVATAIYTDYIWHCPQAKLASAAAALDSPTYRFLFNASVTALIPEDLRYFGKFHGSDALLALLTPSFKAGINGTMLPTQLVDLGIYYRGLLATFVRDLHMGAEFPSLGSGCEPMDMVSVGQVGDQASVGGSVVNRTAVDEICGLFEELYPLLRRVYP